ncbi:hypothetical protein Bca52824_043210 [Brassica carinata]|uniref:Uncharacterized protein n=1 Tax=Brassica carinata TaxID=52824 RepID=A0A8X7V1T1_BRACI|nr:hypothetical protein Bca52824_043210 [Brassica carinata]
MRLQEQPNDLKKQRLQQSKSAGDKKRVFSVSLEEPLRDSADEDGVFLGLSSNAHYQIINILERVLEGSTESKCIHVVAVAFKVGVRFSNNVYGGVQFVDWA